MPKCPHILCGKKIPDADLKNFIEDYKKKNDLFVGTNFTCPHCQTVLWLTEDGKLEFPVNLFVEKEVA